MQKRNLLAITLLAFTSFTLPDDPNPCHGCTKGGGGTQNAWDSDGADQITLQITATPHGGTCTTTEALGASASECYVQKNCSATLHAKYWSTVSVDITLTPGIVNPVCSTSEPASAVWKSLGEHRAEVTCGSSLDVTGTIGDPTNINLSASTTIEVKCSGCPEETPPL